MDDCNVLYDTDDSCEDHGDMGQSDSKSAKRKSGGKSTTKGVASSFGFRRRPASSSRVDAERRLPLDDNGNGGSTEELYSGGVGADALSGRSTPLLRPRKDAVGVPLRTNRFGFRQPTSNKTAKVSDVNVSAEAAFSVTSKNKQNTYNNNAIDKLSTKDTPPPPSAHRTAAGANGPPKCVTRQTVILTYQTQQAPAAPRHRSAGAATRHPDPYASVRSSSASRAYGTYDGPRTVSKYTLQSNQLPRPQYPAVKLLDTKTAKQVANNSRKISGSSDGSREGSATDSGVGGEYEPESPRPRRRPRNLEMVMKGAHSFHLRELSACDLDLMDDAVVTDGGVIPLPKLPSALEAARPAPAAYPVPAALAVPRRGSPPPAARADSGLSTLERYRARAPPAGRAAPAAPAARAAAENEEKFVLDRAQPELLNKQNSFIKCGRESPALDSSKDSSPSCRSDAATDTWTHEGEALASRSRDDVSLALSTSSVEAERPRAEPPAPRAATVLVTDPALPHPLLMKSLTASHHDAIRSIMITSMSSSNYSGMSVSTAASSDGHQVTLTGDESNFDMAALEASTQSLLDDETSPADSLISSSSGASCGEDPPLPAPGSLSSSAYQTADTRTKSDLRLEPAADAEDRATSKDVSPPTPGTPTHASGSLSLSDGRDYFDDEIADQPALTLRKNSQDSPSNRGVSVVEPEEHQLLRKSRERIACSPLSQRKGKSGGFRGEGGAGAERTPSLDTLSSLASDDMMMDPELGLSAVSLHSVDDYIDRLDSSFRSGLNSLTEQQLCQELSSSELCAVKQWSRLLEQNNALDRQLACVTRSVTRSTASLQDIRASLPVRTARLLQRSRAHTPASDGGGASGADGSASPAACPAAAPAPAVAAPGAILQDVVDIKTLLLQLKRVLHEPGEEHHTTSSETLDPLLTPCAEPARGNGRHLPTPAAAAPATSVATPAAPDTADLRRQILYLQSQVEERDRLVRVLQQQMCQLSDPPRPPSAAEDTCNVATQTDRLRPPVPTNLANNENTGLVSWNELNGRRGPAYSDAQIKTKRSVANGTPAVKCQCGRRINGVDTEPSEKRPDLQLKNNSRVGSRYLLAVASRDHTDVHHKRDLSVNERLRKSALYSSRSRSIENFQQQSLSEIKQPEPGKMAAEHAQKHHTKHHTSYSDLYNGRVSAKCNGHSPVHNGQSTDTDYSSDGGYKSLPSSVNCNGHPKKISGIPRRSIESRLLASRQSVKASAI